MNYKISPEYSVEVIIPVRARKNYDLVRRINWRSSYDIPSNFKFTVVDYGSSPVESSQIESACKANGLNYIYEYSASSVWNASKARNIALIKSTADYVFFEDVDLISHRNFYSLINRQIESLIVRGGWEFFVIPVSYLNAYSSQNINAPFEDYQYDCMVTNILNGDTKEIEFHCPASSYLLTSRELAINVGGYDENYEGWGYEDSDFWLKLLHRTRLEKPREFYKLDTREYSQQVQWSGWRALYRLYADIIAYKGIYSFHVWHEIAEHRSNKVKERNKSIFNENTKFYKKNNQLQLPPLINKEKPVHLFLSRNPHSFNEAIFKIFDNPLLIEEHAIDLCSIDLLLKTHNVDCAIFDNPYGNSKRLEIYKKIRDDGIKCYVIERGALPWSIYIDEGGFCAESNSYDAANWKNLELSKEELAATKAYIEDLKLSGSSLEPQPNLISGDCLKRKLFGFSMNVKVLFIPLQSPSDTTTNYFIGQIGSYENFIAEISKLHADIPSDWRIVYKNHPLALQKVKIPGAVCIDDHHIGDALEMCDAVALINSGVGVLSIAYGKPVYFFGNAFYSCPGLNLHVVSAEDLLSELRKGFNYDFNLALKMIWFLVYKFYSFASWTHSTKKHTDLANLSISKDIIYSVVRVFGRKTHNVSSTSELNIRKSILFDRYRLDDYLFRNPKKISEPNTATEVSLNLKEPGNSAINMKVLKGNRVIKKIKKMMRNPKLFFYDALNNRFKVR